MLTDRRYQRPKVTKPQGGSEMENEQRLGYLKKALILFGVIFVVGVPAMMMWVFPSGWAWTPRQPEYEQMIMGVYMTLGVFLILAAKDPLANLSLIWFTVWSSIVHGGIMLVQAVVDDTERMNLVGDIPALFLVAAVFWYLTPRSPAAA
jgi:Family of unknown function (DUF6632)